MQNMFQFILLVVFHCKIHYKINKKNAKIREQLKEIAIHMYEVLLIWIYVHINNANL